jgi:hypothetical protein
VNRTGKTTTLRIIYYNGFGISLAGGVIATFLHISCNNAVNQTQCACRQEQAVSLIPHTSFENNKRILVKYGIEVYIKSCLNTLILVGIGTLHPVLYLQVKLNAPFF